MNPAMMAAILAASVGPAPIVLTSHAAPARSRAIMLARQAEHPIVGEGWRQRAIRRAMRNPDTIGPNADWYANTAQVEHYNQANRWVKRDARRQTMAARKRRGRR